MSEQLQAEEQKLLLAPEQLLGGSGSCCKPPLSRVPPEAWGRGGRDSSSVAGSREESMRRGIKSNQKEKINK